MNGTVLKLALLGSRSSWGRMAGIAAGVAIGVCLLLMLWNAANGLTQRDMRGAWLRETGGPSVAVPTTNDPASGPMEAVPLTLDTVLMAAPVDVFRNELINHRDFAALPGNTVRIPGVEAPPAPGEYYASPALQRLIELVPAEQLGSRYGTFKGTIADSALPGPDSLVVVTGASEAQLRQGPSASLVSEFTGNPYGENAVAYRSALMVGGIAVFVPVLLLISIATKLGASGRRERFATLRLIGASPKFTATVSAAETAIPGFLGALLGIALAIALTPLAAQIPVNGGRLFVTDLAPDGVATPLVVLFVVAASALAAAHGTLRAGIGPLGVSRAVHDKLPKAWRVVPLLAGLGAMFFGLALSKSGSLLVSLLLIGGFALVSFGLVMIGPWLTLLAGRIGQRMARSPAAVIASSRIHRTPVATFRSVSGLVIAVFMVSAFAGASSAIETVDQPETRAGTLLPGTVYAGVAGGYVPEAISAVAEAAKKLDGVRAAAVGYAPATGGTASSTGQDIYIAAADASGLGFENIPTAAVLNFDASFLYSWTVEPVPLTATAGDTFEGMVPSFIFLATDGSAESIDRARTLLNASDVTATPATSKLDLVAMSSTRLVQGLSALAYIGVFVAVLIAGISLGVATAAAILDRQRVLGLMRLMGMPVSILRRVIVREAAVPLLAVTLLSVGLGFLSAWIMIEAFGRGRHVTWPEPEYFATLGFSLLLALGAMLTTFTLVRANAALTTTRFE